MGDGETNSGECGAVEEERSQGGDVIDKGVARRTRLVVLPVNRVGYMSILHYGISTPDGARSYNKRADKI